MKRAMLNGLGFRVPFVGNVGLMVTEGDWRGGAENPRPFMCRYQEPGEPAVQYNVGWLTILRDPPEPSDSSASDALAFAGCFAAVRAIILTLIS